MILKNTVFMGILTILLALVFLETSHAEQKRRYNWELFDQVKVERDSCAKIRDKIIGGNDITNVDMRGAQIDYGECVEKIIVKVAKEFYASDAFGKGGIAALIEEMRTPYQETYWTIYNEAGPCGIRGCGTMYEVFHAGKWVGLMDKMLDDMVNHLKNQK